MEQNDEIRKAKRRLLFGFILAGILFVSFISYAVYTEFYDMSKFPTGEYLTEAESPDGTYTLKAYVTEGTPKSKNAIRGELVFNKEEIEKKNIYWNNDESTAEIVWKDDDTVVINGHTIDVPDGKYDYRNHQ